MISQLSPRDRIALLVGVAVVLLTLVVFGVVLPYRAAIEKLDNQIALRQKQLLEVQTLRQDYRQLQRQVSELEGRLAKQPDFALFPFIEEVTTREGIKDRLVYVRPKEGGLRNGLHEDSVEIRLEKIGLNQLVQLLYEFSATDVPVLVNNLRIRSRFDDRSLLDATMDISSYRKSS